MKFIITNKPERCLKLDLKLFLVTTHKYGIAGTYTTGTFIVLESAVAEASSAVILKVRKTSIVELDFTNTREFSPIVDGSYFLGRKDESPLMYWGGPESMVRHKPKGFVAIQEGEREWRAI